MPGTPSRLSARYHPRPYLNQGCALSPEVESPVDGGHVEGAVAAKAAAAGEIRPEERVSPAVAPASPQGGGPAGATYADQPQPVIGETGGKQRVPGVAKRTDEEEEEGEREAQAVGMGDRSEEAPTRGRGNRGCSRTTSWTSSSVGGDLDQCDDPGPVSGQASGAAPPSNIPRRSPRLHVTPRTWAQQKTVIDKMLATLPNFQAIFRRVDGQEEDTTKSQVCCLGGRVSSLVIYSCSPLWDSRCSTGAQRQIRLNRRPPACSRATYISRPMRRRERMRWSGGRP